MGARLLRFQKGAVHAQWIIIASSRRHYASQPSAARVRHAANSPNSPALVATHTACGAGDTAFARRLPPRRRTCRLVLQQTTRAIARGRCSCVLGCALIAPMQTLLSPATTCMQAQVSELPGPPQTWKETYASARLMPARPFHLIREAMRPALWLHVEPLINPVARHGGEKGQRCHIQGQCAPARPRARQHRCATAQGNLRAAGQRIAAALSKGCCGPCPKRPCALPCAALPLVDLLTPACRP